MKKTNIMSCIRLLLFVFVSDISLVYAQHDIFTCKGIVIDTTNMLPLQNVKIYYINNKDTLTIYSDHFGKFEMRATQQSKLHFRKLGYAWHTVKIENKSMQTVYLLPSKSVEKDIGKENYVHTEVVYDGEIVPQEEWDDVFSTRHCEIQSLRIRTTEGKTKIVFTSRP